MKRTRTYSPHTLEATALLGRRIRASRIERRWTMEELAERLGVSAPTVQKIERGEPSVGLGVAFEAATLTGVPLFHPDPARLSVEAARASDRLAVLPRLARQPRRVDDDF